MKLVDRSITMSDLQTMAEGRFGVDADLHSDEEAHLLENGSVQADLWGINVYPGLPKSDWIEFDSMINMRPSQGNRSRRVEDPLVQERIVAVVSSLVTR
jgi:hypothetical protein